MLVLVNGASKSSKRICAILDWSIRNFFCKDLVFRQVKCTVGSFEIHIRLPIAMFSTKRDILLRARSLVSIVLYRLICNGIIIIFKIWIFYPFCHILSFLLIWNKLMWNVIEKWLLMFQLHVRQRRFCRCWRNLTHYDFYIERILWNHNGWIKIQGRALWSSLYRIMEYLVFCHYASLDR